MYMKTTRNMTQQEGTQPTTSNTHAHWRGLYINNLSNDTENRSFLVHTNFQQLIMTTLVETCTLKGKVVLVLN
jgi:hypothetical protein